MGQGGCERRIKVFGKIQKKNWGGGGWVGGRGGGGVWVGGGGGVKVDLNEELVFVKIQEFFFFLGGGGGSGGSGCWGRGGGVRVDVNEELKFL